MKSLHTPTMIVLLTLLVAHVALAQDTPPKPVLKLGELGATKNVHSFGPLLLCGQPTAAEFAEAKARGIKTVITLRQEGEVDWDEAGTLKELGLDFHRIGFRTPDSLTDDVFDASLKFLSDAESSPVMMHCGSANRVGAIWLAHRVLSDGVAVADARVEAKAVGLKTLGYEAKALDYIARKQGEGEADSSATLAEIKLWPTGLPAGSATIDTETAETLRAKTAADTRGYVYFVDTPSMTFYPAPQEMANGCAVVICPGGGYNFLAFQHEGVELAEWFNSIGVSAFVLKYRVPRRIPDNIHWEPMQDVQRAIRMVRHDADKYGIDAARIGVLGFSAGGHLTVMAGVQSETKCYEPVDDADATSARPDFICPIYAAYLADGYRDDVAQLGPLVAVTEQTPPTFMAVTWDDNFRGAQAALLFAKLRELDVPAELHAYAAGGHGYGIQPTGKPVNTWNDRLTDWLQSSGWLTSDDR